MTLFRRSRPIDRHNVASSEVTITNKLGLHARPAAEFVRVAKSFRAEVSIHRDRVTYSAQSLIDVLRANLDCGSSAILEARGVDAEDAIARLVRLLAEFAERRED